MLRWFWRRPEKTGQGKLDLSFIEGGIEYQASGPGLPSQAAEWLRDPGLFDDWEQVACLAQIEAEGYAVTQDEFLLLGWEEVFHLLATQEYQDSGRLLGLPQFIELYSVLRARGGVGDSNFNIVLDWRRADGGSLNTVMTRTGAVVRLQGQEYILHEQAWLLAAAVQEFARRPDEERTQQAQERAWGHIRQLAVAANASLDLYLERTIILTAKQLDLALRHVEVTNTPVIEVIPRVPGAPDKHWLAAFDGYNQVREHYDLTTDKGERIRVLVEPDARAVLTEIKRMSGRRIAGERAEAFLRNPYALLGDAMARVLPPERFEQAREAAGVRFYTFCDEICREPDGHVQAVRLWLQPLDEDAPALPPIEIVDKVILQHFVESLSAGLEAGLPCFRWMQHTLELRGDAEDRLCRLRAVLHEPWSGEPLITYAAVHDLARYSPRVEGIGLHRPQYVPYIAQKETQGGWVPEKLEPMVQYQPPGGKPVLVSVSEEAQTALAQWLDNEPPADARFTPPGWPGPVTVTIARQLLDTFNQALDTPREGAFNAPKEEALEPTEPVSSTQPQTLHIAQNVEAIDYKEERHRQLAFNSSQPPQVTAWLRPGMALKAHQCQGLAWLQHLWHSKPYGVRGALLADDMGLGKTLQLLAFIAWYLEQAVEQADPALIVAPVSLLENWRLEIDKFFDNRLSNQVLQLYGRELGWLKLRDHEIEESLRQEGIRTHIRPGWLDFKRLVLTTYETLRDLQFSLAQERWSIMVCDEAQKIKTPGAMVTHAAKAQNAHFKIACTGTPVENSLADLWCLFDFIQPGLLGSLSEFCRLYQRPIEAQTEEQNSKLDELRKLIEPQKLRRLKTEVVDLPEKHTDQNCRVIPFSPYQRTLYSHAITQLQTQRQEGNNAALLAMLHRLRSICADPRDAGTQPDLNNDLNSHRQRSPKLDWLLAQLEIIRKLKEKVILFTEFRDLQRLLQYRIRQHFGFCPIIVNGNTKAGQEAGGQSRQELIDKFQCQPGFNVIILSTTAVGFGVNIQAANHVIHFTRPWNPAKEDQATDRAYRIGQTRPVQVYYPTVVAEDFVTFEARLDALLEAKRQLASDMLNGTPDIELVEWSGLRAPDGSPVMTRTLLDADRLSRLQPKVFECLCQVWLSRQGYITYLTPGSGDGGIDVVGIRGQEGLLVQCKSSARLGQALGWEAVRDVAGGAPAYREKYPTVEFKLVAATNQHFNEPARRQAELHDVILRQQKDWIAWFEKHSVYVDEIAGF